jgi:hypothetical protein
MPSITTFDLHPYGEDEAHSVSVGREKFAIATIDGTLLRSESIPDVALAKPAFGDFNNDGINDIVIYTPKG